MNNTFNIQRFGLLLKRQWLEFGKIYLISLLVVLGVIITFYTTALWGNFFNDRPFYDNILSFREPLFLIFGFIFISVMASNYFAHFGQKPKAIIDLLIPASTFEKFLTGIFFTSILSYISFILLFYITDLLFITKLKGIYGNDHTYLAFIFSKHSQDFFKPLYIVPFFITSIFLAGSIFFNKFHYIKTAISVMIFSALWSLIVFKSGEFLFEGKVLIERDEMNPNNISRSTGELMGVLLLLVLTLVFWSLTYIRLKEKEV